MAAVHHIIDSLFELVKDQTEGIVREHTDADDAAYWSAIQLLIYLQVIRDEKETQ
tara:strand:- start:304 stop:468 length:165 start_codon:yes stop_codon:yes gene_type:complete